MQRCRRPVYYHNVVANRFLLRHQRFLDEARLELGKVMDLCWGRNVLFHCVYGACM